MLAGNEDEAKGSHYRDVVNHWADHRLFWLDALCASKAGQLGFMHSAATELAPHNITINAVRPGNIKTAGLDGLGSEYLDKMTASIPMKRRRSASNVVRALELAPY